MTKTKPKAKTPLVLENLGSLITYTRDGTSYALGYLMDFKDKGVYDATHGKVDVTPEQCVAHNTAYDKSEVEGLDNQCQVGQGSTFYFYEPKMGEKPDHLGVKAEMSVKTFLGTVLATRGNISLRKPPRGKYTVVEFDRKGRTFRGKWRRSEGDAVFFERVA